MGVLYDYFRAPDAATAIALASGGGPSSHGEPGAVLSSGGAAGVVASSGGAAGVVLSSGGAAGVVLSSGGAAGVVASSGGAAGLVLDVVDAKGIEPTVTLGKLIAMARSVEWTVRLVEDELVWPPEDSEEAEESEEWITALSDGTRDALAAIPDESVPELAARWAEIEEWRGHGDVAYLREVLADLTGLTRRAQAAGDHVYLWTSL